MHLLLKYQQDVSQCFDCILEYFKYQYNILKLKSNIIVYFLWQMSIVNMLVFLLVWGFEPTIYPTLPSTFTTRSTFYLAIQYHSIQSILCLFLFLPV